MNEGGVKKNIIRSHLAEIQRDINANIDSIDYLHKIDLKDLIMKKDKEITEKLFEKLGLALTASGMAYSAGGLLSQTGLSPGVTAFFATSTATGVGITIVAASLFANALDYHFNSKESEILTETPSP